MADLTNPYYLEIFFFTIFLIVLYVGTFFVIRHLLPKVSKKLKPITINTLSFLITQVFFSLYFLRHYGSLSAAVYILGLLLLGSILWLTLFIKDKRKKTHLPLYGQSLTLEP